MARLLLATAVAVSRVHLGVHCVLDVLVGAALGADVGVGVALLLRAAVRGREAPRGA